MHKNNLQRRVGYYYEFFAGGGMARAGLGENWTCTFANDFDPKKCNTYKANWGDLEIKHDDVCHITTANLPGQSNLVWASFPCQDLSLAGNGAGLNGGRSGTFWPFWDLMKKLGSDNRAPDTIVLENVCGTIHSHGGKDFVAILSAFQGSGYKFGAFVVDAALFLPQSRPRLFIIASRNTLEIPKELTSPEPCSPWHTKALVSAFNSLTEEIKTNWIWWNLPLPQKRKTELFDLIEDEPKSVAWHSMEETQHLLSMMSEINLEKVKRAQSFGHKVVGTVYKRTRTNHLGERVQRAEVRFDNIAGCLRTPVGGSSRQLIIVIEGQKIRSRLMSARETARLMGLPDEYILPANYNEAYHLTGDGVVVEL